MARGKACPGTAHMAYCNVSAISGLGDEVLEPEGDVEGVGEELGVADCVTVPMTMVVDDKPS